MATIFSRDETLEKLKSINCDDINYQFGFIDNNPMIILDSYEDELALIARLNGYNGPVEFPLLCNDEDLNETFDKTVKELHDPHYLGTISKLKRKLKELGNLAAYKRWLYFNAIEERGLGIEIGYSDEYAICGNCASRGGDIIIRISPDSYNWIAPAFLEDCGWICEACAITRIDEIKQVYKNAAGGLPRGLPEYLTDDVLNLVQLNTQESYEHGWYGKMDNPRVIIDTLNAYGIDVWFRIYSDQWRVRFDVYVEPKNFDRAKAISIVKK